MAKLLFTFVFAFILNTLFLSSQILEPNENDSIISGREVKFRFVVKSISLQHLQYSLDNRNWQDIGIFFNQPEIRWSPPFADLDTIFFHYEAFNFTVPKKLWTAPQAHNSEISSLDFSAYDSLFVSSSLDGKVILWHISKPEKKDSFEFGRRIYSVKFFPKSPSIVFSSDTSVYYLDFSYPRVLKKIGGSSGLIRAISISNNKLLAYGSYSGVLTILDTNLNELQRIFTGKQIYSLAFSNNSKLLAVGDYDGIVSIYDVSSGEKIAYFSTNRDSSFKNVVWAVSFSSNDSLIVAGGIDGKVRIYNIQSRNLEYTFPSHSFHIRGAAFCDYSQVVSSVSLDSTLYQVFFPLNFPIHTPLKEESSITSLELVEGGRYLLVGLRNGSLSFYKNFEFEYINQKLKLPYFIPIIAKCGSFQANAGRLVSFPIIFRNIFEVPLNRFFSDTSYAIINLPLQHFGVYHPEIGQIKYGFVDTIYSNLRSIGFVDTFAIVQVYTLHPWDERKGVFNLGKINFRGKSNLLWLVDTSSVEIVEICKPLTDLMKFELIPRTHLNVLENPVNQELKIIVDSDTTIFCKFALICSINGYVFDLFEGVVPRGETVLNFDIQSIPSGVYYLLLDTKFTRLTKKIVIIR
ncbi:MAG: hypothetical protein N2560_06190 [Ignavibacteria bacterium]|nr:hypothetical protein [Ignavibacteria bacterium]